MPTWLFHDVCPDATMRTTVSRRMPRFPGLVLAILAASCCVGGCERVRCEYRARQVEARARRAEALLSELALPVSSRDGEPLTTLDARIVVVPDRVSVDLAPGLSSDLSRGACGQEPPASPVSVGHPLPVPTDIDPLSQGIVQVLETLPRANGPHDRPAVALFVDEQAPADVVLALATRLDEGSFVVRGRSGVTVRRWERLGGGSLHPSRVMRVPDEGPVRTHVLDVVPKGTFGTEDGATPRLVLVVELRREGVLIRADDGFLLPDCTDVQVGGDPPLAVPTRGDLDIEALDRCLATVHARRPDERDAALVVRAGDGISFGEYVRAWDALLGPAGDPRFPLVHR